MSVRFLNQFDQLVHAVGASSLLEPLVLRYAGILPFSRLIGFSAIGHPTFSGFSALGHPTFSELQSHVIATASV